MGRGGTRIRGVRKPLPAAPLTLSLFFRHVFLATSRSGLDFLAMDRKLNSESRNIVFMTNDGATTELLHAAAGHSGRPTARPARSMAMNATTAFQCYFSQDESSSLPCKTSHQRAGPSPQCRPACSWLLNDFFSLPHADGDSMS